ncbi:hypothetical protein ACC725_38910, partial [Rhizobium ruizarguesonis]
NNGWLVNSNGQVCQTTDGGLTWRQRRFIDSSMAGFPYLRCMAWPNERVGLIGSVTKFSAGKDPGPVCHVGHLVELRIICRP